MSFTVELITPWNWIGFRWAIADLIIVAFSILRGPKFWLCVCNHVLISPEQQS